MGYDRIAELIRNEEKPYEYCLEFEYGNSDYMTLDPIVRYLTYKSTGITVDKNKTGFSKAESFCVQSLSTYGNIPDCDGSDGRSLLTLDVYNKLWNWEKGYYSSGEIKTQSFKGEFGGDTMNSMQTTFNAVMKNTLEKPENNALGQYRKNNYSFMDCLQVYCDVPQRLISELHKEPEFTRFVNLYHTIGNMVLVPRRFNSGRYSKTYDFWDSSLVWLKKDGFYYGQNQMFDKRDFTKYINYFYLWNYVDCVNGEYKVKPLFESHNNIENGDVNDTAVWTNLVTKQDVKQFLNNACKNITTRGLFMTILLRLKALKNPEIAGVCDRFFNFIQSEEFLSTAHKNAYQEALSNLLFMLNQVSVSGNEDYQKIYEDILTLGRFCNTPEINTQKHNQTPKKQVDESKENKTNNNKNPFCRVKCKIGEMLCEIKREPPVCIAQILFILALLIGVVAATCYFVDFLKAGGYSKSYMGQSPAESYFKNNLVMYSMLIMCQIGFVMLCVSYIKEHKIGGKLLMIIPLALDAVLIFVVAAIAIVTTKLVYKESFVMWLYSACENNPQLVITQVENYGKLAFVISFVVLLVPFFVMVFNAYYRKDAIMYAIAEITCAFGIPMLLTLFQYRILAILILIAAVVAVFIFVIRRMRFAVVRRCPSCKRFGALYRINSEVIGKEAISIRTELEDKDADGKVVAIREQYIPGVRRTYRGTYRCKHCGYIKTEISYVDIPKV